VIDMLFGARQDIETNIKRDGGPNVVNLPSGEKLTGEGADIYMETLNTFQKLLDVAVYHLERLPQAQEADTGA
jgi:hypothetical protein